MLLGMTSPEIPAGAVVVAVDGSAHADRALAWAARHARIVRRPLVLLHATGWQDARASDPLASAAAVLGPALEAAREAAPEVTSVAVPVAGDPRVALVDASLRADHLVLGSHGRGVFRTLLLGSVSAAVSKHAHCPVVVVRGQDGEQAVRRVLVGADGSPESRPVVEHAYRLASWHAVHVVVVHCYWDVLAAVAGTPAGAISDPDLADLGAGLAELVAGLAEDYPDVQARLVLEHGLVDAVLTSGTAPGDVVVVGRHVVETPARLLSGSIATAVLERARTTVVVVPEGGAPERG